MIGFGAASNIGILPLHRCSIRDLISSSVTIGTWCGYLLLLLVSMSYHWWDTSAWMSSCNRGWFKPIDYGYMQHMGIQHYHVIARIYICVMCCVCPWSSNEAVYLIYSWYVLTFLDLHSSVMRRRLPEGAGGGTPTQVTIACVCFWLHVFNSRVACVWLWFHVFNSHVSCVMCVCLTLMFHVSCVWV